MRAFDPPQPGVWPDAAQFASLPPESQAISLVAIAVSAFVLGWAVGQVVHRLQRAAHEFAQRRARR